jgi:outer-membrane receptor for ferric coprogen and ferric-rhodotorulic acid
MLIRFLGGLKRMQKFFQANKWSLLATVAAASVMPMMTVGQAYAQEAAQQTVDFNVPAQDLATALSVFGRQAGVQFTVDVGTLEGKQNGAVRGRMTRRQALAHLLAGLAFNFVNDNTVGITPIAATGDAGERVLGAVRVEGAQGSGLAGATSVNGINGSRDVTATEGTKSYTSNALTLGTKTATSLKETPMTLTVLTAQRLQDQAITDFKSALAQAPGITLQTSGDSLTTRFYSRGFEITNIQIDGGPGIQAYNATAFGPGYRPLIDLSLYDHVEVLRGAAGAFNGYGDPGGVVNLVRKKPLDHQQFVMELQAGSWQKYRVMTDVTGPLGFDGKLRGRAVLTVQGNHYFYDTAKDLKNIAYGVLDLDITPTTLVTVGASYQKQDSTPWSTGLMRFSNGNSLNLPRSKCLCFNWSFLNSENVEYFGQLEQKIASNWALKLKATYIKQSNAQRRPYTEGSVDPVTLTGVQAVIGFPASVYTDKSQQRLYEATLNGSFTLFGRTQNIIVGANISSAGTKDGNNVSTIGVDNFDVRSPMNVFNYNSGSIEPRPLDAIQNIRDIGGTSDRKLIYLNADLQPFEGLHIISSWRYSAYSTRSGTYYFCDQTYLEAGFCPTGTLGERIFLNRIGSRWSGSDFSWPPNPSIRYDILKNLSVYATYADIYTDQSTRLKRDGSPIDPVRGANYEGGVKWAPNDGRLNLALSGFYTKKNGLALRECRPNRDAGCPNNVGGTTGSGDFLRTDSCCYINNPKPFISYGLDFEISGEIARNFEVSAGYTYNITKDNIYNVRSDGSIGPIFSFAAKHLVKIWGTYRFPDEGALKGLIVGGGVNGQSKSYVTGFACTAYDVDPNSGRYCSAGRDFDYTEPGRAIISANIQYDLNRSMSLSLNLENLLDKTYYQTLGGVDGGNWYGNPRSFTLTLRTRL